MNHSETDISLLEKYFDAELSDAEMKHFTSRMENDENFKTLFEREKALIGAIRHQGIQENLQYLKTLEESFKESDKPVRSLVARKWYYLAAAALVGILVVSKMLVTTFSPTPKQLYEAYFTPYPNLFEPTVRSSEAAPSVRSEAFQAYEQKDYRKAVSLFNELLSTKEEPGILLLLGNANLILGNVEAAKENFIRLNKDFDTLDMQSKWYLSLCYLRSGDIEQARNMLKELGETEISYAEKAKELLKKVD